MIDDKIHSPTSNLVCGVSDYNMGGLFDGKYYNSLNENYYYLQPSAFTFLSDNDCYDHFT
ncbi:MAG: hypothetical protein MJ195_02800 [Mycoplasmoidaceae bacterium]|nr:hypothetical protein [Mycoplasmoidaceae bacterium]